ncbi:hypothetical protein LNP04_17670 [Chryseobacterium sp. C-71]|uniref:hypothetical protein n=1 Tax=Chryseobacterium sp. C-71 TaxID=2893882 RepID=UPI001E48B984|nr:hypothetical protein [Chryseobacterium sp. C-71]UFH31770.1 hypothetical protein LNP04_17670 [Chryseobacterium sp. C-71]
MIKKIFFLSFLSLAVLSAVSCRTDEDIQDESYLDSKVINSMKLSEKARFSDSTTLMMKEDSILVIMPNDPPRSGTHFKGIDSLIIINPR